MRLKAVVVLFLAAFFVLLEPAKADKSYRFTVGDSAKAGSIQLQPGEYSMVLDNSKVRFTHVASGKEFEVTVKVDESAQQKYTGTEVHSQVVNGARQITAICLGGTKTKLAFD